MDKNNVFEYDDFLDFLTGEVEKSSRGRTGQKKKISEALNIPPSLLSQTFTGSRKLTEDQVYLFCEFMGYSALEREFIFSLYALSNVYNKKFRSEIKQKLEGLRKNSIKISERVEKDRVLTDEEKSIFYSSWFYIAVWVYSSIGEGKTADEIAEKFDLPMKKVKEVLEFLVKSKICKLEKGRYTIGTNRTHIEKHSPYYRQHHSNWRIKSIQNLDQVSEEDLNFTAPLSLSLKDFEKLREDILQMIQNVYKTVKDTEPDEIYCLNIDLFKV